MRDKRYSMAIETSGPSGSVALGCGDKLLALVDLPAPRRHRVALMPAIESVCREYGVVPSQLEQVFVSIGPGSFTGLRIAVTTAKMLAMTQGTAIVPVPTADVIAQRVTDGQDRMTVCLGLKRGTVWAQAFERQAGRWAKCGDAMLTTLDAIDSDMTIVTDLDARADDLWRLGRSGAYAPIDPATLLPIYARPPEAQEQWQQRYGKTATIQTRGKA
jgi:tRNA threonylcarbamoyl adenosine modification protein YeaZ